MTEDEAKTKWCPYARVAYTLSGEDGNALAGVNRGRSHYVNSEALCLGSACSQWRWEHPPHLTTTSEVDDPGPGPEWSPAGTITDRVSSRMRWKKPFPNRSGYCGPAGKPNYDD